jgi:RsiW-degrading membrane proteinase PrsW (M82 family)
MATGISRKPAPVAPAATGAGRYVGDIVWAARVTIGVVLLLASRAWPSYWHQVSCVIILAALTYPVRSVRWGTIYNFLLVGMIFAYAIIALQYAIEEVLLGGKFPVLGSVLVAPTTEEFGKVLPLLVIVAVGWRGFRTSYGACDLMLCGAALGAGFGLVEDAARSHQSFAASTGPELLGVPIFPDSYSGFMGHSATAAMIALTVGYLVYALRRRRYLLPAIVAVLVALFWMMVDHGLANYASYGGSSGWFAPIRWLWAADGNGRLSPYVLFALILATIVGERIVLWRMLRGLPRIKPARALDYVGRPLRSGWGYPQLRGAVLRVRTLLLYLLSCRRLGYLRAHWSGATVTDQSKAGALLKRYGAKVMVTQLAVRQS